MSDMKHTIRVIRNRALALLASSLLTLSACGGGSSDAELPFSTVLQTTDSAITSLRTVSVSNPAAWAELWAQHTAQVSPKPPLPAVDFAKEQVVGVFLGTRSNGCYSVEIRKVVQSDSARTVVYHETTPSPTASCLAALVNPVHMVKVATSTLPLSFRAQ